MRTAAFIGEVFHIDPIAVLDSDTMTWHIRLAAFKIIQAAYEKRAEKR